MDASQLNVPPLGVDKGWLRILPSGPVVEARLFHLSKHVAQVFLAEPVAFGTAVSLNLADDMFLGEVSYCRPDRQDSYFVGIEIEQVLANVGAVKNLMERLLDESGAFNGQRVGPGRR